MKRQLLERLLAERGAKRPVVLATDLASGEQWLLEGENGAAPLGDTALRDAAARALARDECQTLAQGGRTLFLEPFGLPLRLLIVGAVHIAQPLARMAALAEYQVVVVDPRSAFASEARFPGVTLSTAWPDQALAALAPDERTAVVTLTHDPKLDDPALVVALRSAAFYVGALGSRKTHAARLERLRGLGLDEALLARIHAPVGLAIGARSPGEIAVSILAEMTQRLRAPEGR